MAYHENAYQDNASGKQLLEELKHILAQERTRLLSFYQENSLNLAKINNKDCLLITKELSTFNRPINIRINEFIPEQKKIKLSLHEGSYNIYIIQFRIIKLNSISIQKKYGIQSKILPKIDNQGRYIIQIQIENKTDSKINIENLQIKIN
ncbi:hypothetical protein ABPG72_020140 [Tetrahymena utriculariae]